MTPEELDEARAKEAERLWSSNDPNDPTIPDIATVAARLAREGWTPPKPVVDPDLLAFREYFTECHPSLKTVILEGDFDFGLTASAYLAGARMAREQARPLAQYLQDRADRDDAEADRILAKYRGEA